MMVRLWTCNFHSDCCFCNNGLHSLITRWLCFVWVRAGFLLPVSTFFTKKNVIRSFSDELFQIVFGEAPDEYPQTILVLCFDGIKTFVKCSPAKYVVVDSNTGPVHYQSKPIPIVNLDHCEVVYTVCIRVLILLNCLSKVVSRGIVLVQLMLKKHASCGT